jgi:hypothetical protein
MLKSACAALALLAAASPALALPPAPSHDGPPAAVLARAVLTVDSPLRDLVLNPATRPVIERHMPGFAGKLESDPELAAQFGGISLSGLQQDPHVRGMTPAALAVIGAELAEAQTHS